MSAADWSNQMQALHVKHQPIEQAWRFKCTCGFLTPNSFKKPDNREAFAAHVMAEVEAAGLAATEVEQWPEEVRERGNRFHRTGKTIYRYLTPKLIRDSEPGEWGTW